MADFKSIIAIIPMLWKGVTYLYGLFNKPSLMVECCPTSNNIDGYYIYSPPMPNYVKPSKEIGFHLYIKLTNKTSYHVKINDISCNHGELRLEKSELLNVVNAENRGFNWWTQELFPKYLNKISIKFELKTALKHGDSYKSPYLRYVPAPNQKTQPELIVEFEFVDAKKCWFFSNKRTVKKIIPIKLD